LHRLRSRRNVIALQHQQRRLFQNPQKEVTPPRAVEPAVPLITTARDEVEVSVMIEAL
jgi:hypothetical protein